MNRLVGTAALLAIACAAKQFEVASIRLNKSENRAGTFDVSPAGDRLSARNLYLGILIQRAYGIDEIQFPKAPAVPLLLAKYDVDAKAVRPVSRRDLMLLLRGLLAERFQLRFHTETKEVAGYALVNAKDGPKLRPHEGEPDGDCKTRLQSDGALRYENCSMAELASYRLHPGMTGLCGLVGLRFVADQTGLTGKYDFDLIASWEVGADGGERRVVNPEAPSVFTALEQQLGLKLEARKVQEPFFQIDHLEAASEN